MALALKRDFLYYKTRACYFLKVDIDGLEVFSEKDLTDIKVFIPSNIFKTLK